MIVKFNISVVGAVRCVGNNGRLTVVNSRTVVESPVIKVICHFLRFGRLDVHTDERRRAVYVVIWINQFDIVVLCKVSLDIYPSVLGNISLFQSVNVFAVVLQIQLST